MLQLKHIYDGTFAVLDLDESSNNPCKMFVRHHEAVKHCQDSGKKWLEYCNKGTIK